MVETLVEFEYLRYKDGPDVPVVENPHYFVLIRFLGLISNTSMAIEWTFEDVLSMFENEELTDYSRNLHLKLLGFLGKRFPPHVTLEKNLTRFLDERPIDVSVIFWDKISSNKDNLNGDFEENLEKPQQDKSCEKIQSEGIEEQENENSEIFKDEVEQQEEKLYNPYRDNEYRNVQSYERLRTIRILLNTCIQESKQLRSIFQKMENYSMKCKNVKPGECFFGLSPPYIGDDKLGHHYWYINPPNDEVIFKLYRESSLTGELTLLSDNSDTLCSTFKTFLNSEDLYEIGQKLEVKYNSLVVAEKAKLRKIRQMRSIRNQLESSWGNCAPTDEMLSGGRAKRKATLNIDYSYSKSEIATRRSSRINRLGYDSDSLNYEQNSSSNNVKDRSDRLALRNAKKQQIEESEKDHEITENDPQIHFPKVESSHDQDDLNSAISSQTPIYTPIVQQEQKIQTTQLPNNTPNLLNEQITNLNNQRNIETLLGIHNHHSAHIQSLNLAPTNVNMQLASGVTPTPPSQSQNFSSSFPAFNLSQVQQLSQINKNSQIPQAHQLLQLPQFAQIPQVPQISQIARIPQVTQISQIQNLQTYNPLSSSSTVVANGSMQTISNFPNSGTSNIQYESYTKS